MFEDGSIPLGSIASIPVRLHVTFPVVLLFSLLSQSPWNLATLGWASLLYGPILLATVLTHELGHSLAARRADSEAHGILLWPLGGLAFIGHSASPKVDLFVAIMGPLTHIPQFLLWFVLLLPVSYATYGRLVFPGPFSIPSPQDHFWVALLVGACWLNVMLAAFNLLLPAYPLDGGRILAGSLLLLGVGEHLAARIVAGLAVAVGLGVLALGAYQFSLITVLVGLWMLYTNSSLVKAIKDGTVEQHPLFSYEESTPGIDSQATKAGYQPYTGQASV